MQLWIGKLLCLSGQQSAGTFPTSGCCCVLRAEIVSAAAASSQLVDQLLPASPNAKAPAGLTTPPSLRVNQSVCLMFNVHYIYSIWRFMPFFNSLEKWVGDFSPFPSQAQFSDTEEDYSSRAPASRHLSSDVKQVRHASQRSKVRGYNTEYERTASQNPADSAICHLSPITVSTKARCMV